MKYCKSCRKLAWTLGGVGRRWRDRTFSWLLEKGNFERLRRVTYPPLSKDRVNAKLFLM